MGLKQFNLDLRAAASSYNDPHVTNVRKGDSDGEIVFTYGLEGQPPLEIQALSTDADSYPRHSSFMIFTSSDHATKDMDEWLQSFTALTEGKNVTEVISLVSRRLTAKLSNSMDDPSIAVISSDEDEAEGDSAFDSDDFSQGDEDEEYRIDITPLPPRRPAARCAAGSPGSTTRLKRHLRDAKSEGFCISVPFTKKVDNLSGIFSLSIRVSKLAIPEEALEAWDLRSSEYVVMLIKLPMGYPSVTEFIRLPSDQSTVQFRFGKCASPKPSYHTMRRMFEPEHNMESQHPPRQDSSRDSDHFLPLYMSASLNSLLNQEFPSLLRLRRSDNFSWDQAHAFKFDLSRGSHFRDTSSSVKNSTDDRDSSADWFSLELLRRDYVSAGEDLNIFLVAMQFGLQRLIKCTKYCMVCHQRMDGGFEAVKPFVCGNLLCLYQYLSLGFGQSIEHDIVNNPAVVDLLISFFYCAVFNNRLREFPQGLGLKWADPGSLKDPSEHLDVDVSFRNKTIWFSGTDYGSHKKIKEGDCVLLVIKPKEMTTTVPILHSTVERHTCIIESVGNSDCTFRIVETQIAPMNVLSLSENETRTHATHPSADRVRVMLFQHNKDIDEIQITDHSPSIVQGMGAGWMQFRFAQGSPEKEEAFFKELTKLKEINGQPKTHPSLFAWHGSPLENWHSIIRTGLDFSTTLHGRAYGNGVYLGKEFSTSQGYTMGGVSSAWPNSRLNISSAISMCEIVNNPAQYVSTQPHFVINKIEWIQCRYLFVRVNASSQTGDQWCPKKSVFTSKGYLTQDPQHRLIGDHRNEILIPLSAIPTARRRALGQHGSVGDPGLTRENPILLDEEDGDVLEEVDGELDDLLASDVEEEDSQRQMVRKRRRTSTDSGLGELRPSKLTTGMQDRNNTGQPQSGTTTAFRPGGLDLASLPKLAEPTWATSSPGALRALNREIKDLQKIQSSTDLASLGWYIDFDKLDNMFHWIVELHSFDVNLPLAQDMKRAGCSSIVLELRFGSSYPISPPFVRVIRPRFLPFVHGGGGHVTIGGAICSELLTNSGWSPALSLEKVFLEVRMNLCDMDPPARLDRVDSLGSMDYNIFEAIDAFRRAATAHGWQIPSDVDMISSMSALQQH
ncbi:uncharacterized protein NECHADRAFT_40310 [Fusarium vanettenii 77-13-4]|uniref:UBC core domain-containing protein n=1 Tax=Fusarium vanettenii (strain ATCC MYA-4622 / CBS 123669 / FGSC 9596 / NRRL 45880 / 77-13-4) TaxID=660122 RepID=C7Z0X8_FUSV7|nr:uncharacterized protein NECHADRAFT_40310 [Fusarium vanettenii 77-13-4]EEU42276.1 hypothetical protein NECHADRAFT_40310 [Fusarium vanettenii 77-13-4]